MLLNWLSTAITIAFKNILKCMTSTMNYTMPVLINPPAKVTKQTIIHTIDCAYKRSRALQVMNKAILRIIFHLFTSYKVVTLDKQKLLQRNPVSPFSTIIVLDMSQITQLAT